MPQITQRPASRKPGYHVSNLILQIAVAVLLIVAATTQHAAANSKYAGIVVDAKTGRTLYANDANAHRYPASLTKMMTLYLTFEALDAHKISLNTRVPVSRHAAAQEPSKLYLKPGQTISVRQAILGIVTRSANDVATALGEKLGGTETNFARLMTHKAHALGMARTTFKNANGLPARRQMTTARDMATLGIALREHFPEYYHYFSTRRFMWRGHAIGNHNHLLGSVQGVDGIKTGYTYASGFNLVTSLRRNDRSIVAVVMGGRTWRSRDAQMRKLIAAYLPKAATHGSGDLVAETRDAPTLAAVRLPRHDAPIPMPRSTSAARVALAYADDTKAPDFPLPDRRPVVGRQALIKTLQEQEKSIAVPLPAPQKTAVQTGEGDQSANVAKLDDITTSATPKTAERKGWVIQIGATPDHASAVRLLDKARSSNHRLLASADPFTVAYNDDGDHMYRARFSGFASKGKAWAACASLKRNGYGCWATVQ